MTMILRSLIGLIIFCSALRVGAIELKGKPMPTPSAEEIMQRAAERTGQSRSRSNLPPYLYRKTSSIQELDDQGRVVQKKEKEYEVRVENGLSYLHLIRMDGAPLSPAEAKKQEEAEVQNRKGLSQHQQSRDQGDERESFLTSDLIAKYQFTYIGAEQVAGRESYIIGFVPKPNLPVNQMRDRLVNRLQGRLWIDAEESEIARAEIRLPSEVKLWGGMLGAVRQFDFQLERIRLPEGVWLNKYSRGDFRGRKLFDSKHMLTLSESSEFRKARP